MASRSWSWSIPGNRTAQRQKNVAEEIQKEYQVSDKILTGKDGEELEDPKLSFTMVKKDIETVDEDGNPITVTVWEPEFTVSGYVDYTGNWAFDSKKEGILNASSEEGRLAVNGMSYRSRDSKNANSAIIISVTPEDSQNRSSAFRRSVSAEIGRSCMEACRRQSSTTAVCRF